MRRESSILAIVVVAVITACANDYGSLRFPRHLEGGAADGPVDGGASPNAIPDAGADSSE